VCPECLGRGVVKDAADERPRSWPQQRQQLPKARAAGGGSARPQASPSAATPSQAAPAQESKIDFWIRELEAEDYKRRVVAARELGKAAGAEAIPALERMSGGTENLWVLFDEGMRTRARMLYTSGFIPATDAEMLRRQLQGNNLAMKTAAKDAIAQIKERANIATPVEAALKVLNETYLASGTTQGLADKKERVAKALDSIQASQNGVETLLARLCEGVTISGGRIALAEWGDLAWNELLKKREIVRCFQRGEMDARRVSCMSC
jgi:hypothetical protein